MELVSPVTLTGGSAELVLDSLAPVFIDDSARKLVLARLHPALSPLMLWRGDDYDAIGDWTQAQAEARILERLGADVQTGLQSLVVA
jgi:hypothetical protein